MRLSILDVTYDPRLLEYAMNKEKFKGAKIFNFYSLVMYGLALNSLIPVPDVMKYLFETEDGDEYSKNFDILYANQLLINPNSFVDLMTLMDSFQSVEDTIVLSNYTHPNMTGIIDSLLKFIQERYGIYPLIINTLEDIDELRVCDFESNEGYINLMTDLDRFRTTYFSKEQLESM